MSTSDFLCFCEGRIIAEWMLRKTSRLLLNAGVTALLCNRYTTFAEKRSKESRGDKNYDVAIIGGGVVGLAVARALAEANKQLRIVIVEKEDSIAAGASSGTTVECKNPDILQVNPCL